MTQMTGRKSWLRFGSLGIASLVVAACATTPVARIEPAPMPAPITSLSKANTSEVAAEDNAPADDVADGAVSANESEGVNESTDEGTIFREAEEPVYTEDDQQLDDSEIADEGDLASGADQKPVDQSTLWQRMQAGFELPNREDARVAPHINWYVKHPAYVERAFSRAAPFLHFILSETERRGMPAEIALLPVVESAFQPFAYSRARASGIWQFIPGTATRYGLKINWWYDGRRDILASTEAALDYLQDLNKTFNGDWLLALAAYNCGEGNVMRAIEKNIRRKKPTNFWALELPKETRGYVPRLLAISAVVKNPAKYGIDLRGIPDDHYFTPVQVDAQIDMALASEMAGLNLEDIYHLNPGFSRWATDPAGPQQLLLPLDKATDFSINLGNMPDAKLVEWQQHRVHKGESLAQLAQQYGTTPEVLRQINNLGPDRLKTGQTLLIPLAQKTTYALVSENETRKTKRSSGSTQTSTIHKVRSGESLWSISRKYDLSVTQLAALNKLSPSAPLHAGKKIIVHKPNANRDNTAADDGDSAQIQLVKYIVRKGDNLFRIAQKFNVTVQSLLKWNSELLAGNNAIRPGQKLTLFVDNKHSDANS